MGILEDLAAVPSYFQGNDPNVNAQLRQRIAMAMMAKQRRYPKTFGEGLSAIGESLGDIGMARRLGSRIWTSRRPPNYGAADPAPTPPSLRRPSGPPTRLLQTFPPSRR
jgi:hypothetical protein